MLTRQPWIGAGNLATPVCASFIETGRRWAFKDRTNRGAGITFALLYLKLKIQTFQQVFHAFTGVTELNFTIAGPLQPGQTQARRCLGLKLLMFIMFFPIINNDWEMNRRFMIQVVTAVIAGPPASLMRILVNGKAEGPRLAFAHGLVRNIWNVENSMILYNILYKIVKFQYTVL